MFDEIEFGQLTKYKVAKPYYIWSLKLKNADKFIPCLFKSENALIDQSYFLSVCMRELGVLPKRISLKDWITLINTALICMRIV